MHSWGGGGALIQFSRITFRHSVLWTAAQRSGASGVISRRRPAKFEQLRLNVFPSWLILYRLCSRWIGSVVDSGHTSQGPKSECLRRLVELGRPMRGHKPKSAAGVIFEHCWSKLGASVQTPTLLRALLEDFVDAFSCFTILLVRGGQGSRARHQRCPCRLCCLSCRGSPAPLAAMPRWPVVVPERGALDVSRCRPD